MRQKNIEQKEEYEQLEVIEKPVIVDKTDISKITRSSIWNEKERQRRLAEQAKLRHNTSGKQDRQLADHI